MRFRTASSGESCMRRCKNSWRASAALFLALAVPGGRSLCQAPGVPAQYARFFYATKPRPASWSRIGDLIGLSSGPYPRSYALVAGISEYELGTLKMAEQDVTRLAGYLEHYESFDEIVVLRNRDVN